MLWHGMCCCRNLVGFAHSPCSVPLVFEHISGEVSCILTAQVWNLGHWNRLQCSLSWCWIAKIPSLPGLTLCDFVPVR